MNGYKLDNVTLIKFSLITKEYREKNNRWPDVCDLPFSNVTALLYMCLRSSILCSFDFALTSLVGFADLTFGGIPYLITACLHK